MAFRWPKEGVSVVLLPSGELGQQVLSLAKEWTAHRLLAPSLFVVVEEQDPRALEPFTTNGPVRMAAHVIGRDGSVVDSLIDQLGRDDIDLLRILACRFVEDSKSFHQDQDRLIDRIRDQVETSIARHEKDGSRKVGTDLLLLNLISGPTMRTGGSTKHLVEFEWDANIVLSPENRSTPAGFDTFTDDSDPTFAGFILSNIASTVGLWTGINKSVLELSGVDQSSTYNKVVVQRTFGRVVKTDGIAIRMAASALKEIEDHGNPAADPTYVLNGKERLKDEQFQSAISKLVEDTLGASDAALRFNFDVSKEELTGKKIGFVEGLKMLGAFLWDKIVSFPRNLLEAFIETFNRKATKLFFGENSDIAIDVHKDLRRYGMQVKDGEDLLKIQKVKDSVKSVVDDILLGPTYRGQHPQLWQQQRELILAVLDGNSPHFPDKILADTEKLIPKHGNVWTVPEFLLDTDEDPDEIISSLDWLDVDEAQKISTRLEEEISLLQSELRDSRQEMHDAEKEKLDAKAAARKLRNEREREASKDKSLKTIIKEFGDVTS
jgi:molecular chaperone GrpE (heat shock protein)